MRGRMLTELRREIRRSLPRFLSILVMVALGVLFLVGLRSAAPDMRRTADNWFDEHALFDLQIVSTLGLTEEDAAAFAAQPGVACAEGGWSCDAIAGIDGVQYTVKLLSLSERVNHPVLLEGRLPEKENECAVDEKLRNNQQLRIGDTVTLDPAQEGTLTQREFTVTGFVHSPLYVSIDRGTGSLGDGSIAGFLLLPKRSFASEVYSVVHLLLADVAALDAYGADYDALAAGQTELLTALAKERGALRYETVLAEGEAQIRDAEQALEDARAEAERELGEAEAKLENASRQLDEGREALAQGERELEAAKRGGEAKLEQARAEIRAGHAALEDAERQLDEAQAELDRKRESAPGELDEAQAKIDAGRLTLAEKKAELDRAKAELTSARAKVDAYLLLLAALGEGPGSPVSVAELETMQAQLAAAQAQYDEGLAAWNAAKAELDRAQAELDAQRAALPGQLSAAQKTIDDGRAALQEKAAQLRQAEADLKAAEQQLPAQLAQAQQKLDDAAAELERGEREYADGQKALEEARRDADAELSRGQREIRRAKKELGKLSPADVYVLGRDTNYGFVSYDQNAQRMENLAKLFPMIFFLVAALVCLTTMTRMVEEERTQIGAVKALGYGTGAIAGKYLGYGLLAALLGALLGCVIGSFLIPWVIFFSYSILYVLPALQMKVDWQLCLLASGAGVGLTLAATLLAVLSTARQSPALLMRPKAPKPGKRILLEHIRPLWKRLSFSVKVSARNLFRYKKRLWMTVAGVAGCTALLIAGLGLRRSIYDILDLQFFDVYRYDVQCSADEDEETLGAVRACLAASDNVRSCAELNSRSVSFRSGTASVNGYLSITDDPAALQSQIELREMDGTSPVTLTDEGAVIDQKLSELLGLSVGDLLTVDAGKPFEVRVAAINEHYVYHYAYLTAAQYEALSGERYCPNTFLITVEDDSDEAVSALSEALLQQDGVRAANNVPAMARSFRDTLRAVDSAIMVIITSAAALAVVVLYNLTNINVTERTRELATIKVLGFYDREVGMYVYRENIVLTLLGIGLGQILGRFLCRWLVGTIEMDIVMFGRRIGWQTHLWSILLTLLFAVLVNFLMFFRMKRIGMVESLKSVE